MRATFVYDGDCAFCTTCARFLQRWVPTQATITAWQFADLAGLGLTEAECDQAVQWVAPDPAGVPVAPDQASARAGASAGAPRLAAAPAKAAGPDAIAALLRTSHWAWRLTGRLLQFRPVRLFAWPAYRWVARNRHRMPGGTAACVLPAAARQSRAG